MVRSVALQDKAEAIAESNDSEYGSDLDEAVAEDLFTQFESRSKSILLAADIEQPAILDDHGDGKRTLARLARVRDNFTAAIAGLNGTINASSNNCHAGREASVEVEYDEGNRSAFSPKRKLGEVEGRREAVMKPEISNDTQTPLQRFRTPPKKPLSVTDIISPAWCELQYWYNLTKYGRVRRTPAMKQGSSVHKELEEQVHIEVPVEVVTKEDRFALRIWNIIQGLRTLMRTGMTRELEVWGILEGEVVNGIIDQITTTSPDEEVEAQMLGGIEKARQQNEENGPTKGRRRKPARSSDQRTLTEYLTSSQNGSILEESTGYAFLGTLYEEPRTLYLVDVKTRQSNTLPAIGSQLRPTHYQLMLYHHLFSTLAANGVPAHQIFARYGVDPDATLSDAFIAQMSTFDIGFELPASTRNDCHGPSDYEDSVTELLKHNTLNSLWSLMTTEFSKAVPMPSLSSSTPTVSPLLTAEFRSSAHGAIIGKRYFAFDATALGAHVTDELKWWRGERETKGVEIEEAFKCGICEFAEDCTWRKTKVAEVVHKARLRKERRERSAV